MLLESFCSQYACCSADMLREKCLRQTSAEVIRLKENKDPIACRHSTERTGTRWETLTFRRRCWSSLYLSYGQTQEQSKSCRDVCRQISTKAVERRKGSPSNLHDWNLGWRVQMISLWARTFAGNCHSRCTVRTNLALLGKSVCACSSIRRNSQRYVNVTFPYDLAKKP